MSSNNTERFFIVANSSHAGGIASLYNKTAWIYNFVTDFEPTHHRAAIALAEIKEGDTVLEVACGTGRATTRIAERVGKNGQVHALDLTPGMLRRAEQRLQKAGMSDRVHFTLGDARRLPFADETFDAVFNAYMFDLIDLNEMQAIVDEFKRVLKPGGSIILVNMSKNRERKTMYEFFYERGWLSFVSGSCRPVVMEPFLKRAGFEGMRRTYRRNYSWFFLNWFVGTEIVFGRKP